ncbi:MAG: GbsR/MarR family transcriptional regulator [Pseudomonadota bacterium]
MKTTAYQQAFILHFGEMGSRWGINRTVGQVYALLYVNEAPLNADDITAALSISRSNTSMALKELQAWRLVRLQHLPDDRRDYFSAPEDIWEIFRILVQERRKREIDPTLSLLRNVLLEPPTQSADSYAEQRMKSMLELIELVTSWLDDVSELERGTAVKLMKLGGGVQKLLTAPSRLKRAGKNSTSGGKK